MKVFVLVASAREGSINLKLANVAKEILSEKNEVIARPYREYDAPLYHQDDEAEWGQSEGLKKLETDLSSADAVVIASPEYNYAYPGTLKNLIDWMSRVPSKPIRRKPIFLMGTSPGGAGAGRGLWQLRIPLEGIGGHVFPDMFTLPGGFQAFQENGKLVNEKSHEVLEGNLTEFLQFAERLSS